MKGWFELDTTPAVLHTPEDETLELLFAGLKSEPRSDGDYASSIKLARSVGANGELVSVFGGLGADGSMVVCGVEERHDG